MEDDDALQSVIKAVLECDGYRVAAVGEAGEAIRALPLFRPDLAVLDVRLPDGDGFELARAIRSVRALPLLFLTAADALEDRLRGFELGADDYLVKPVAMPELLARVRAVLRSSGVLVSSTIEIRDVLIDEASRTVLRGGTPVTLTAVEFGLLVALARSPGTVFSKARQGFRDVLSVRRCRISASCRDGVGIQGEPQARPSSGVRSPT